MVIFLFCGGSVLKMQFQSKHSIRKFLNSAYDFEDNGTRSSVEAGLRLWYHKKEYDAGIGISMTCIRFE